MGDDTTILIVDDEPAIADGHAARLEDRYDTLTANAGRAALDRLDEAVDAVVLDRRMPGMSGREVLDAIRDRGHDCPVVMLTGVEPDQDVVDMPYDAYLRKPVDGDDLRETLEGVLSEAAEDELLDTLGDQKTRRCCQLLASEPRTATELAEMTGYSPPTVYRRLNALTQVGIVEARATRDEEKGHYDTFRAVPTEIRVQIGDVLAVDVSRGEEREA